MATDACTDDDDGGGDDGVVMATGCVRNVCTSATVSGVVPSLCYACQ